MKFVVNNSTGAMSVVDYYTPYNVNTYYPPWVQNPNQFGVCLWDADFGSGGIMVFPDTFYNGLNLSVIGDKQSNLYVLNRDNMGRYNPSGGNLVELNHVRYTESGGEPKTLQGFWSTPAYWKYVDVGVTHYVLYSSVSSQDLSISAYPMDMYDLLTSGSTGPIPLSSTHDTGAIKFCRYSPTPVVSSNGNTANSGIVWAIEHQNKNNPLSCDDTTEHPPVALHAFNATTLAKLYNSRNMNTNIGPAASFDSPTVFQGRVYVGTNSSVNVFGLCNTHGTCLQ